MSDCDSLWQTEALHEGRLQGKARERAERHVDGCSLCREQLEIAAELRSQLVALGGDAPEELELRRRRQRLLGQANTQFLARDVEGRAYPRRKLLAVACVLVAACAGLWLSLRQPHAPPSATLQAPARAQPGAQLSSPSAQFAVHVTASAGADYTRQPQGRGELIELRRGQLELAVEHGGGARRLLVKTPDLEIEDQGTVFTVRVADGVTQLVAVAQGRVAIRGAGPRVILLEAGERWTEAERAPTSGPTAESPHVAASSGAVPAVKSRSSASSSPPPNPPLTRALNAEAAAFEAAMLSFRAGDWSQAVGQFRDFQASFPGSPRGEDASYLTVISLQRAGRQAEVARAASAYLKQYPHGFRAREIQRLNGSP